MVADLLHTRGCAQRSGTHWPVSLFPLPSSLPPQKWEALVLSQAGALRLGVGRQPCRWGVFPLFTRVQGVPGCRQ